MKILIMGLPGSGKSALAEALARNMNAVWFNADDIRANINKDLGFSHEDRVEQSRRMGHLCGIAARWGAPVIADLVCPTPECREAFAPDYVIWVDRIKEGRYEDTNKMFVPPEKFDIRIISDHCYPEYHATEIAKKVKAK